MKNKLFFYLIIPTFIWAQNVVTDSVKNDVHAPAETKVEISESIIDYYGNSVDSPVWEKDFEEGFKEKYKGDEFDYTATKPRISLWEKFKNKLREIISYFFRSDDANALNKMVEWVLYFIAFAIVSFVVYLLVRFLMGKEGVWFFGKKPKEIMPEERTITENIHEINFDEIISKYESQNNFRFAVRYQFLQLLKIYTDRGFIEWQPDKTNLDYLKELKDKSKVKHFKNFAYLFDNVWYGEFEIDENQYENYKSMMKNTYS